MLNVEFNNGMSINLNEAALKEVMTHYFSHMTTFLNTEGASLSVALLEKESDVELPKAKVETPKAETVVAEEPATKPKKRKRRTKEQIEADAKAQEEEDPEKSDEEKTPTEEESEPSTPTELAAAAEEPTIGFTDKPVQRDLMQEAIDEHPETEEEPVGEIRIEDAPQVTEEIDLGRPLFS